MCLQKVCKIWQFVLYVGYVRIPNFATAYGLFALCSLMSKGKKKPMNQLLAARSTTKSFTSCLFTIRIVTCRTWQTHTEGSDQVARGSKWIYSQCLYENLAHRCDYV